ncbi:YDG domain-containing protein, partial [Janthinobacterium sp. GW458P]|uniref:YDG domain-containing protein n=1 Tax=Janthinobacterium sp. GW458P TaxID=1981504 RepID=UPI00209C3DCB
TVTLGALSGAFSDKNAGNGKTVAVSGGQLGDGTGLAANYSVNAPASVTAAITPKPVSVSGLAVADKTADGTTAATISTPGTLAGLVANDIINLDATSATAKFAQSAPGIAIPVSVTGLTLIGADAGNYVMPASSSSTGSILTAPARENSSATAAAATITPQAVGIASSFVAPAVGGLAYVAVAESVTAPQSGTAQTAMGGEAGANAAPASTPQRRQSSSQGAGANRDVKYLDVMVVSGGIRMPASASSDTDNSPAPNSL